MTAIASQQWDEGPFHITAIMTPDPDSQPDDADCYSDEDKAAYAKDEWSFVQIVVSASIAGIELGTASLSGMEYGVFPGSEGFVDPMMQPEYWADVVDEAIESAEQGLQTVQAIGQEIAAAKAALEVSK